TLAVLRADEGDTGDVAAGMSVARHELLLDGEGDVREHDGDGSGGVPGRAGRLGARRADHVDAEGDQLPGKIGEALGGAVRPARLDHVVAAFLIALIPQSLAERVEVRRSHGGPGR